MADTNAIPDPFSSRRYLATVEAVPHLFASAFPKVDLLWFRAFRPEICGYYTGPFHKIIYAGHADDLLAHGLLLPEMIPPGRKVLRHYEEPGDPSWDTTRRAKGRIQVEVDRLPGPLPALVRFGTDRWPFFGSPHAAREYGKSLLGFVKGWVEATTSPDGALATGRESYLAELGFAYHPEDRAAMAALTSNYCNQLAQMIQSARIQPIGRPSLRVVSST